MFQKGGGGGVGLCSFQNSKLGILCVCVGGGGLAKYFQTQNIEKAFPSCFYLNGSKFRG